MSDVFISYRNTPARRPFASRLAVLLDGFGANIWWDEGLQPGGDWARELRKRVGAAKVVLPLWCAESVKSEWVLEEARIGRSRLLPCRLQRIAPPSEFSDVHSVDLSGWRGGIEEAAFQALATAVFARLRKTPQIAGYKRHEYATLPALTLLPEIGDFPPIPSVWRLTETTSGWSVDVTFLEAGKLMWKGRGPLDIMPVAGNWRTDGDRIRLELSNPLSATKAYEGVADPTRMQGPGWRAERA